MLAHGVPWQFALGDAFLGVIIFSMTLIMSLISGFFDWPVFFTAIFLVAGFYLMFSLMPTFLNLSRTFMWLVALMLIVHILTTLVSFSLHYMSTGLLINGKIMQPSFYDSIYFSITTFSTLGYGDFQPLPEYRLTTSIEALTGMISMAVGASFIWLWCQENLIDKEMAFFDGYRRHKTSLSMVRMRVRTITGKERELPDWRLPPENDTPYYYDESRGEWLPVTEETEVPENAQVLSVNRGGNA